MSKKAVNIMVFSIALIMLLLRPYVIYQLTGQANADRSPVKTSLLQRLIKKKEDHYQWDENAVTEIRSSTFSFRPAVKQLPSFYLQNVSAATFLLTLLAAITAAALLVGPVSNRYSLSSCFRI
jgi:hypothetical protein